MKKLLLRILLVLFTVGLIFIFRFLYNTLPILTGYGAKHLCSCAFVGGRSPQDIIANELGRSPLSYGSFSIDSMDSTVTGTVLGLFRQKAVFRKGWGCTLINGTNESELKKVKFPLSDLQTETRDTLNEADPFSHVDTLPAGLNTGLLNSAIEEAFREPGPEKLRRTRAVVVLYDGKLITERYAPGFNGRMPQAGWSMAKSITNALIGILVKKGKLDINAPAPVKEWQKDERHLITLRSLMQASSGLSWEERYDKECDATNMLFKAKDMGYFAVQSKMEFPPDTYFEYSSGTSNILSRIIRETVGERDYPLFPYTELFNRIGMLHTTLEPDAGGTFVGSSYCFASARDWARFGLLYLNDGIYNGERILPEGWVTFTSSPAKTAPMGEYGAQFWLNAGSPDNPLKRKYPGVPADCFYADGFEGQAVWIIPSKKLVVVKLSLQQGNPLDENQFLKNIIASLPPD